jgi:chromosome partitioning protein
MTIIVAVINQKGGVGKTTTAVNLAACLGVLGHSTLLIDADPQANCSISYGVSPTELSKTFYTFLVGEEKLKDIVKPTIIENLSILPTNDNLYAADLELTYFEESKYDILRDKLNGVLDPYEFAIIDSPPHLGPLTLNIMKASNTIIIPLKADFLALHGLVTLYKTYQSIRLSLNPDLSILGILLTMFSSGLNICKDVETSVRETFKSLVFENKIPQNVTIAESPSFSVPVIVHGPKSVGALSYMNFTMEFLRKVYKSDER